MKNAIMGVVFVRLLVMALLPLAGCQLAMPGDEDYGSISTQTINEERSPAAVERFMAAPAESSLLETVKHLLAASSTNAPNPAYSNIRRFLTTNQPASDAVRLDIAEEKSKQTGEPVHFNIELTNAPWNSQHQLLLIGMQGKSEKATYPPNNLVFLVDMSGSMDSNNGLPSVISSLRMLLKEMRPEDRVSIVVHSGAEGLADGKILVEERKRRQKEGRKRDERESDLPFFAPTF
jgi:hypothetical protein